MPESVSTPALEDQIERWRSYLRRRQAIEPVDVTELEDHLREQIAGLSNAGLDADEAFLVAVKRMGDLDALSREFAREHSDRLWKQLVVAGAETTEPRSGLRTDAVIAFTLAVVAAVAVKVPTFLGVTWDQNESFYARNLIFFILPLLTGYFSWKRRLSIRMSGGMVVTFLAAVGLVNLSPLAPGGSTESLAALHLPIALLFVLGMSYAGDRWSQVEGRMDFIRFLGELFIYYVLIALGGGVVTGFMGMMFQSIGIDIEPWFEHWLLPCGAAGGVFVAAWLVEAKQSVIENMAPVLTRLFTPFFTVVVLTFLGTVLWTGRPLDVERDLLIVFDLLLVFVLALLLYSLSARDPRSPAGLFDVVQFVLIISTLAADAVALWAIVARINEFGFTPNRVAGLGMNVILLVNLAWSAVLCFRFLRGRGAFGDLERWQTGYLTVYAVWAAIVVIAFPPLFGYI